MLLKVFQSNLLHSNFIFQDNKSENVVLTTYRQMLRHVDGNHKPSETVQITNEVLTCLKENLDASRKAANDLRGKLKYRDLQVCCIKEKIKNGLSVEQYKSIEAEIKHVPGIFRCHNFQQFFLF